MANKVGLKEIVLYLLENNAKTRDDDPHLFVMVHAAVTTKGSNYTLYEALSEVDYSSVIRERRKVQVLREDLRGTIYGERLKKENRKIKEYSPKYWERLEKHKPRWKVF